MKGKRAAHDVNYRLYKLWRQAALSVMAGAGVFCDAALRAVCRALVDSLNDEAHVRALKLDSVRRLIARCEDVSAAYTAILERGEFPGEISQSSRDIWEGVRAVLSSRVKLIEEHIGSLDLDSEVRSITNGAAKTLIDGCESAAKRFRVERAVVYESAALLAMFEREEFSVSPVATAVCNEVTARFIPPVCKLFAPASIYIDHGIEALLRRATAKALDELLIEEKGILGQMINIQLERIEDAADGDFESMRDIYKLLCAEIEAAETLYPGANNPAIAEGALGESANAALICVPTGDIEGCATVFQSAVATFSRAFGMEWDKLSREGVKRRQYGLSKLVFENAQLAGELSGAFESIRDGADNQIDNYQNDKRIAEGILETISIKIENIAEERESYSSEMRQLLAKLPQEDQRKEREKAYESLVTALAKAGRDERKALAAIHRFSMDITITGGGTEDRIKSKSAAFLKDCALNEISTFEEILNYSVTILRKSDVSATKDLVTLIDKADACIMAILAAYGIEAINPAPHTVFDGRENEVLTAEPAEGFAKGEIIKVLNKGYRRGGAVLSRANVVAAK